MWRLPPRGQNPAEPSEGGEDRNATRPASFLSGLANLLPSRQQVASTSSERPRASIPTLTHSSAGEAQLHDALRSAMDTSMERSREEPAVSIPVPDREALGNALAQHGKDVQRIAHAAGWKGAGHLLLRNANVEALTNFVATVVREGAPVMNSPDGNPDKKLYRAEVNAGLVDLDVTIVGGKIVDARAPSPLHKVLTALLDPKLADVKAQFGQLSREQGLVLGVNPAGEGSQTHHDVDTGRCEIHIDAQDIDPANPLRFVDTFSHEAAHGLFKLEEKVASLPRSSQHRQEYMKLCERDEGGALYEQLKNVDRAGNDTAMKDGLLDAIEGKLGRQRLERALQIYASPTDSEEQIKQNLGKDVYATLNPSGLPEGVSYTDQWNFQYERRFGDQRGGALQSGLRNQGISDPDNYVMPVRLPPFIADLHPDLAQSVVAFPKSMLSEEDVDTPNAAAVFGALTFLAPAAFEHDPESNTWNAAYRFVQADELRTVNVNVAMSGNVLGYSVDRG